MPYGRSIRITDVEPRAWLWIVRVLSAMKSHSGRLQIGLKHAEGFDGFTSTRDMVLCRAACHEF